MKAVQYTFSLNTLYIIGFNKSLLILYNTNSHEHDSHKYYQFKLCNTSMFRNLMKAAMFTTITGIVTVRPPKEHIIFFTYFPLFTSGKLVQLKHCITTSVVLNRGN
jgi:hypothetical protein